VIAVRDGVVGDLDAISSICGCTSVATTCATRFAIRSAK
jgi:hypothetical protein